MLSPKQRSQCDHQQAFRWISIVSLPDVFCNIILNETFAMTFCSDKVPAIAIVLTNHPRTCIAHRTGSQGDKQIVMKSNLLVRRPPEILTGFFHFLMPPLYRNRTVVPAGTSVSPTLLLFPAGRKLFKLLLQNYYHSARFSRVTSARWHMFPHYSHWFGNAL